MRRLGVSLLVVVVISVVGAGWAIDRLFLQLDQPDKTIRTAEALGYEIAELVDANGQALSDVSGPGNAPGVSMELLGQQSMALPAALQSRLDSGQVLTLESEQGVSLYFALPETRQVLRIALPEPGDNDTRTRLLLTLLFYAAITALILLWLFPLVRRLQTLTLAARRFGGGELAQRIETHERSQLYGIESEFNRMAQRIESLIADNRLLSSAVSHDLKTPLARLRFGVDALSEQPASAVQADYLQRISHDLSSMEQLVEVLLEFARLDQSLSELPLQVTHLPALVETCVQNQAPAGETQIELVCKSDHATILAEPRYIRMLVNNLLQNAVKFSNQRVRITVSQRRGRVVIDVEDDGSGFGAQSPERLLKPFTKGVPVTGREPVRGHGMGLAIVHRIVEWHKASIRLGASESLGGARVSVRFDAAVPAL